MQAVGIGAINLALVLLLAPLFEGVMRKLKARIQSRQGPPITQPYYDILKLLGKEDLRVTTNALFNFAPIVTLLAIMVVTLFTPFGETKTALKGDVIVWTYFLGLAAVATMLSAFASQNPFAYVGAAREMMSLLTAEPVIVIALVCAAVKANSLMMTDITTWQAMHGISISTAVAGVAFFLALLASIGKIPFDTSEAESELMAGPLIEQGGPRLALFKLAMYSKQVVFASIFVQIFLPWPKLGIVPADIAINLAKVFALLLVVGVIDSVNPRLRIDQSMKFYGKMIVVSLAALAFAVAGL